eukprot:TRINITY_DN5527_c0_g1_i9.p1 TRINITY_DN5527_c0_g1~~TRINITY_DN5527_c0_g1_i9.p1  ORF type:complete len:183 (+),score=2.05 TRINITY_DN5527_c0_g1_i9:82-630(+)
MGGLISALWRRLFDYREYKICLVGLDNAGKTTCLYQMHLGEVVATKPTIGSNVEEVVFKNVKFHVWDLGGQESLRATWATYFIGTHAVIMVVDSSDRERIHIVKEELWRLLTHKDLEGALLLVFANKQDMEPKMTPAEIANQLNLVALKDMNLTWHIQACCALTGEGLFDGIDWITTQLSRR